VLRPSNRNALHSRCHVFYLRSSPEELFRRLRHDTQRPLLQVQDPLKKLRDLYRERDPLYRRTAHFVVEAARPSVQALASMVMMQLELAGIVVPSAGCDPRGADRDSTSPSVALAAQQHIASRLSPAPVRPGAAPYTRAP
jgi:hypothetical protein